MPKTNPVKPTKPAAASAPSTSTKATKANQAPPHDTRSTTPRGNGTTSSLKREPILNSTATPRPTSTSKTAANSTPSTSATKTGTQPKAAFPPAPKTATKIGTNCTPFTPSSSNETASKMNTNTADLATTTQVNAKLPPFTSILKNRAPTNTTPAPAPVLVTTTKAGKTLTPPVSVLKSSMTTGAPKPAPGAATRTETKPPESVVPEHTHQGGSELSDDSDIPDRITLDYSDSDPDYDPSLVYDSDMELESGSGVEEHTIYFAYAKEPYVGYDPSTKSKKVPETEKNPDRPWREAPPLQHRDLNNQVMYFRELEIPVKDVSDSAKCRHIREEGKCSEKDVVCYIYQVSPEHLDFKYRKDKKTDPDLNLKSEEVVVIPRSWGGDHKGEEIYLNERRDAWLLCIEGWEQILMRPGAGQ